MSNPDTAQAGLVAGAACCGALVAWSAKRTKDTGKATILLRSPASLGTSKGWNDSYGPDHDVCIMLPHLPLRTLNNSDPHPMLRFLMLEHVDTAVDSSMFALTPISAHCKGRGVSLQLQPVLTIVVLFISPVVCPQSTFRRSGLGQRPGPPALRFRASLGWCCVSRAFCSDCAPHCTFLLRESAEKAIVLQSGSPEIGIGEQVQHNGKEFL